MGRANRNGVVAACGVLLACGSVWAQGDQAAPNSGKEAARETSQLLSAGPSSGPEVGIPVVLEGQTVFRIYRGLGPFTAEERAQVVSQRLERAAADLTSDTYRLREAVGESATDVQLNGQVLFTVTDADAQAEGMTRDQLAARHLEAVESSIERQRSGRSSQSLVRGALEALGATLALIVLLVLVKRARWAAGRKLASINLPAWRVQNVELVSSRQLRAGGIAVLRALRILIVTSALYLYVPLVLSLFPWTRRYATELVDYVLDPLRAATVAVLDYIPSLFVVVLSAAGSYALIRLSHVVFSEVGRGNIQWEGFYKDWAEPTHKIVRLLILAMTAVVVFPYLPGSGSPAFQGISIFLGVLFSLGSTSAVANIIAGVILTYTRAFQVGDRVKIADSIGDVTERSLLATRIKSIKNEFVTIPNSIVLSSHIVNYSESDEAALILHTSVTIGYDAPWRTVHALLLKAAANTEGLLAEPAPFVLQTSLDDFYVSYQVNAYTDQPARMQVIYGEWHQNIQDAFNAAGVEIMSPHYRALRDGNRSTVVPPADAGADH